MTTRTAEALPLIYTRVAGLRAPLLIKTSSRYVNWPFSFMKKEIE